MGPLLLRDEVKGEKLPGYLLEVEENVSNPGEGGESE